jgi:2'-5' RNA ligase
MSDSNIRLFAAADIPDQARELVTSAVGKSRGNIPVARWVEPENLHLTLKFIGAYPQEALGRLSNELRETGGLCAPFEAALGGCGAFPSSRKARVIWVGMSQGVEGAAAVTRKLDARLEKVGVEREGRPFRGHITLARLKQPRDCEVALDRLSEDLVGLQAMTFMVDEIILFRSILEPQGPTYIVLERIALGGKAP